MTTQAFLFFPRPPLLLVLRIDERGSARVKLRNRWRQLKGPVLWCFQGGSFGENILMLIESDTRGKFTQDKRKYFKVTAGGAIGEEEALGLVKKYQHHTGRYKQK